MPWVENSRFLAYIFVFTISPAAYNLYHHNVQMKQIRQILSLPKPCCLLFTLPSPPTWVGKSSVCYQMWNCVKSIVEFQPQGLFLETYSWNQLLYQPGAQRESEDTMMGLWGEFNESPCWRRAGLGRITNRSNSGEALPSLKLRTGAHSKALWGMEPQEEAPWPEQCSERVSTVRIPALTPGTSEKNLPSSFPYCWVSCWTTIRPGDIVGQPFRHSQSIAEHGSRWCRLGNGWMENNHSMVVAYGGSGSWMCSHGEFKKHLLLYSEGLFPLVGAVFFSGFLCQHNNPFSYHIPPPLPSMSEILSYRPHSPQANQEIWLELFKCP